MEKEPNSRDEWLTIRDLIEKKAISEGMIPKVEAALRASELGVEAVHIIDGRVENSLLLEVLQTVESVQ